jgi:sporulation protein YlmC with PRC-barrel domain
MRLSELLGREVRDSAGAHVGTVIDVRLAQDGPPQQLGPARIRVTGLVVSPRHSGRLLGYDRVPYEGPWLIRVLVRAYNHGTHYVPWAWIRDHEQHPLRLDKPARDLPHLRDIPGPVSDGSGG